MRTRRRVTGIVEATMAIPQPMRAKAFRVPEVELSRRISGSMPATWQAAPNHCRVTKSWLSNRSGSPASSTISMEPRRPSRMLEDLGLQSVDIRDFVNNPNNADPRLRIQRAATTIVT
jgi:hypothetical protein